MVGAIIRTAHQRDEMYLAKKSKMVHAHGAANATKMRSTLSSPSTRIGIQRSNSTQDMLNMNLAGALVCNDTNNCNVSESYCARS